MVRAAAKNFKDVVIITDKKDYSELIKELKHNKGKTNLDFREKMAGRAFNLTAYYDAIVAEWFNKRTGNIFPEKKTFFGRLDTNLPPALAPSIDFPRSSGCLKRILNIFFRGDLIQNIISSA